MYDIVPEYSMKAMYLHDNKNVFIVIVIVIVNHVGNKVKLCE